MPNKKTSNMLNPFINLKNVDIPAKLINFKEKKKCYYGYLFNFNQLKLRIS